MDSNKYVCSPCLGSHWAPQLAFKSSKEAFDICLRCVFKETLCSIFLPSQPGVGFVEVRVQTSLRSTTIQQLRRWWLGLPWTTAECGRNEYTYLNPSQQQEQQQHDPAVSLAAVSAVDKLHLVVWPLQRLCNIALTAVYVSDEIYCVMLMN